MKRGNVYLTVQHVRFGACIPVAAIHGVDRDLVAESGHGIGELPGVIQRRVADSQVVKVGQLHWFTHRGRR